MMKRQTIIEYMQERAKRKEIKMIDKNTTAVVVLRIARAFIANRIDEKGNIWLDKKEVKDLRSILNLGAEDSLEGLDE